MTSRHRTLLGFDYGSRRIGVAVGQELTGSANPLETIATHGRGPDWEAITRLVAAWQPAALVVGIPFNMDGTDQGMTRAARRFANQLRERFGLPVHTIDERLSSREARQRLAAATEGRRRVQEKEKIDQVAAQIILQTWLSEDRDTDKS